jgi:acetyl-CoA C-acetyltransferase
VYFWEQDVVMTGGMESMTNAPYYVPKGRFGMKYGHGTLEDSLVKDGLWDVYNDVHMGSCAEKCSNDHNISREEQDEFTISSYKRAVEAIESGRFKDEIVPVEIKQKKGDPKVVSDDEEPNRIKYDKIPQLPTAFKKDGSKSISPLT